MKQETQDSLREIPIAPRETMELEFLQMLSEKPIELGLSREFSLGGGHEGSPF